MMGFLFLITLGGVYRLESLNSLIWKCRYTNSEWQLVLTLIESRESLQNKRLFERFLMLLVFAHLTSDFRESISRERATEDGGKEEDRRCQGGTGEEDEAAQDVTWLHLSKGFHRTFGQSDTCPGHIGLFWGKSFLMLISSVSVSVCLSMCLARSLPFSVSATLSQLCISLILSISYSFAMI